MGGVFFGQQAVNELRFTVVADGDDGAALGYGVGVIGGGLFGVDGVDVLLDGFDLVIEGIGFLVRFRLGLQLLLELALLGFELFEFGGVFLRQGNGRGLDAAKLTKGLVIGLRLDVDPLPPFGAGFGGQRLQLFIHQAGEQFWIGDGGTLFAFGEEIAGDEASGGFIGVESDEADAFIGSGDLFFEEDAADDAGILAVPFGELVPDAFLRGVVVGEGEGLENFEVI